MAQGTFISHCATKRTNGFYFGMFHMFYMSSQLSGNYLASWLLGVGHSQSVFIWYITVISLGSTFMFGMIKEPKAQEVTGDNEYESTDDEEEEGGGDIEK